MAAAVFLVAGLHARPACADAAAAAWAAAQIKADGVADFDASPACRKAGSTTPGMGDAKNPDPPPENTPPGWANECRKISDAQLLALLQIARPDKLITLEGVDITTPAASAVLAGRDFANGLTILYGAIGPRLNIDGSHFNSLDLENVNVTGVINAENTVVDSDVKLDNLYIKDLLDLTSLKTGSYLTLATVRCDGCGVDAQNLNVGGNFYIKHDLGMRSGVKGLRNDFSNSMFARSVYLVDAQSYQTLDCKSCSIGGGVYIQKSVDDDTPPARRGDFISHVDFSGSHIGGDVAIRDAVFESFLDFDAISAGNFYIMSGASIQQLLLRDATLTGSLLTDPRQNLAVSEMRLTGTSIGKELDLSGFDPGAWRHDAGLPGSPLLDLTDATTGAFTDCTDSFPGQLLLNGFTYGDFRHAEAESDHNDYNIWRQGNLDDPGLKDSAWLAWLAKGRNTPEFPGASPGNYDPQPYLFLAKLLAAKGFTSYADDILLQSRKNEMSQTLAQGDVISGAGLLFLYLVAGFGIGYHLLQHIFIVIVVSLALGTIGLKCFGDTVRKSWIWCVGAAIDHLLPVVHISSEFADFFDGKLAVRPTPAQKFCFALYAVWGWIVSALLVTAVSGLTQMG